MKIEALCHPNRIHYGHQLCHPCYGRVRRALLLLVRPDEARKADMKFQYGITPDQYRAMVARQRGVCAICKNPPKFKRLGIDHDHETKRIRGLLCWRCNYFLVSRVSSPDLLRRAADYLESTFDGRNMDFDYVGRNRP